MQPYDNVWKAMSDYTDQRDQHSQDELWVVQHPPVFTQGRAGKPEHLINPGDIPVVKSDRGGQVTYHGPGQLVLYPLLKLKRYDLGVRDLVRLLESTIVDLLATYQIDSFAKPDAPGVYVNTGSSGTAMNHQAAKIASLGLRIRRGYSFHGLSVNVSMDLSPFERINPCGFAGMQMTQISDLLQKTAFTEAEYADVEQSIISILANKLDTQPIPASNPLLTQVNKA